MIETNNRNRERELVLKPIDGKAPKDATGMINPKLFTGEVKLFAVIDPETMLWSLKYTSGVLPQPLRERWTSMTTLLQQVKEYFKTRNIEIVKVID